MRGDLAREVFAETRADGFSFDVEVLGRFQRRGARVVEFPVRWVDVPGSTFVPLRHGLAAFAELADHRLARALRPAGRRTGACGAAEPTPATALDAIAEL